MATAGGGGLAPMEAFAVIGVAGVGAKTAAALINEYEDRFSR